MPRTAAELEQMPARHQISPADLAEVQDPEPPPAA
jgi:hypothetical protein